MKNKDVRRLVYLCCWDLIVLVAHFVGMKCCFTTGGIGNIIAGVLLMVGSFADTIFLTLNVVSTIMGEQSAKDAVESITESVTEQAETCYRTGQEIGKDVETKK